MKKLIRIVLFALVASVASPLFANGLETKNEATVLSLNTTSLNKVVDATEKSPMKSPLLKKKVEAIKKAAHDGGVVIGISSAALLIIIIILLIILL